MIGQETIDRIRVQTAIVELIAEAVKLTRRGRSFVGLCPFHKEKTPSFHVSEERGFYYCFGCKESGDAIRFVQQTEGLEFAAAVRRLAERAGIEIVEAETDLERKRLAAERQRLAELYAVGNVAAGFFEKMLREHPLAHVARAEIERRGLPSDSTEGAVFEALSAFRVGYAPYGWDALAQHLKAAGISHKAAEAVGLLSPRRSGPGHYDRFRHRLMFAVLDLQGRVVAFSGRALPEAAEAELSSLGLEASRQNDPPAKYINSPESPIYKKGSTVFGLFQARQEIRNRGVAVLVEGNFDVVSLHARGIKNVVAPLGTAFTLSQAQQLKRFAPNLTLLFDGDAAGRNAVLASRDVCRQAGLFARVALLPEGADPDDLVRRSGPEAVERVLGAAQGLLEHCIEEALDGFDKRSAQDQAQRVRRVADLLAREDDPTLRVLAEQHADRMVAAKIGATHNDARTFRALAARIRSGQTGPSSGPAEGGFAGGPSGARAMGAGNSAHRARSPDRRERIGQEILGALLDYPVLLDTPEAAAGAALIEGDPAAAIVALRQSWDGKTLVNPQQVLAKLAPSIQPFALARLAAPRHERLEDARTELSGNVKVLQGLEQARRKDEVVEGLKQAASAGDFELELSLLREHDRRVRERHGQ